MEFITGFVFVICLKYLSDEARMRLIRQVGKQLHTNLF